MAMTGAFGTTLTVNDGGNGGAAGGAATAFAGIVTLELPEHTMGTFDGTELNQADEYEQEYPTGVVKVGDIEGTMKYTKAQYQRLQSLVERGKGYTYVMTCPTDGTAAMTVTFTGFLKRVAKVTKDKSGGRIVPVTFTVQSAGLALT